MDKQLKVLLTTNMPAPYMVDYLDYLGDKCDLTVVFEMASASHRERQWYGEVEKKTFHAIFLNVTKRPKIRCIDFRILQYMKKEYDRIIIANPTTPTGIIALLYCRWNKIPFVIQSEGGFRGSGRGLKERLKKYLMEKAELFLSGMKGDSDYFLSYGATPETLRWYPFTSLKKAQIESCSVSEEDKCKIRTELTVTEKRVLLSVGRTIPCKGFDVLLKACKNISDEVGVYIVGGNVTEEYSQIIEENRLEHIHFVPHCDPETLRKYYCMADVFVLATRGDTWGLVINEAMACGLPVITTERCIAGMQLIENGINGYIVPTEDATQLREKIEILLNDHEKRSRMSNHNLNKIREYSIENMAEHIYKAISE